MQGNSVGAWAKDGEVVVAHAEVIAVPAVEGVEVPDGAIQMRWVDSLGFVHVAHLVQWWRLDRQGLAEGVEVQVDVQARQRRDLSCPPHHVSATLVVTGDPEQKAQVCIGDASRPGSWAYGVVFHGAVLVSTTVPVQV